MRWLPKLAYFEKAFHLACRGGEDEIGGHDAKAPVAFHPLGFLVEAGGKGFHAGEISVRIRLVMNLMLAVQEFRNGDEAAGFLANDIGRGILVHRGVEGVFAERETPAIAPQDQRISNHRLVERVASADSCVSGIAPSLPSQSAQMLWSRETCAQD